MLGVDSLPETFDSLGVGIRWLLPGVRNYLWFQVASTCFHWVVDIGQLFVILLFHLVATGSQFYLYEIHVFSICISNR